MGGAGDALPLPDKPSIAGPRVHQHERWPRETLKELITGSYTHVWQGDKGTLMTPTVEQAEERMDRFFITLNALREAAPDSRKYLMAKAGDLAQSINNQHLQISL